MISRDSSSKPAATTWRREALFTASLAAAATLVYFYRPEIPDERRFILVLAAAGFFFAPRSEQPMRLWIWFPAVALVAWGGRWAARGEGDLGLWIACSVVGAALAVRAGGRAAVYYLPVAGSDTGAALQGVIRRNLQASFTLFAAVFLWDGVGGAHPDVRGALIALSAIWFLRYLLLQAKFLQLPARSLTTQGLVPAQRWPFLALVVLLGATRLPDRLLPGEDDGPLLMTSLLLFVLAGLVFAMALVRLDWPKSMIRKTSFLAGMGLAVALAAVVVELEAWGPARFTSFTTFCTFVLLVLPFAHATTRLFEPYPRASELIGPPILSVMMAPVTAINGWRWELTSTGFLFALSIVMVLYHLIVAIREGFGNRMYLLASLAALGVVFFADGTAWSENGAGWKVFLISLGFVLYAVDLRDRAGR